MSKVSISGGIVSEKYHGLNEEGKNTKELNTISRCEQRIGLPSDFRSKPIKSHKMHFVSIFLKSCDGCILFTFSRYFIFEREIFKGIPNNSEKCLFS